MSNIVIRKRRGTTISLSSLVAEAGEIYIDLTKPTLIVMDGTTAGGIPLAHEVHTHAAATPTVGGSGGTAGFMSPSDKFKLNSISLNGGIQTLLSNTSAVPSENTLNFSTAFTLTDNPGALRTDLDISTTYTNSILSDAVALIIALE